MEDSALHAFEIVSVVTGVGYAGLAAMRNRLCWIAGAVSAACAAVTYGASQLPMQSGLQVFFVVMAVYGWINWTRSAAKGSPDSATIGGRRSGAGSCGTLRRRRVTVGRLVR